MAFPVDESFIAEAEGQLGRRLPDALRARLKRNNGGEVLAEDEYWTLYPIYDSSDRKRIGRTANHIVTEQRRWQAWSGFPEGALAIGDDGSGNALVVLPGSDVVEAWDHETREREPVDVDWD